MGLAKHQKKFREYLDHLSTELSVLAVYHQIWLGTWPTEDRVRILNRYKGFFRVVQEAVRRDELLRTARLFDRDPRTISIPNLIKQATDNSDLLPYAKLVIAGAGPTHKVAAAAREDEDDTGTTGRPEEGTGAARLLLDCIEAKLKDVEKVVKALVDHRNKRGAHFQYDDFVGTPFRRDDFGALVLLLRDIVNDLSNAHDRSITARKGIEDDAQRHTKNMLQDLEIGRREYVAEQNRQVERVKELEAKLKWPG